MSCTTDAQQTSEQTGMKERLLKNVLLTSEIYHTVSGAAGAEIVPVYVGLDYHSETTHVRVMDVER